MQVLLASKARTSPTPLGNKAAPLSCHIMIVRSDYVMLLDAILPDFLLKA